MIAFRPNASRPVSSPEELRRKHDSALDEGADWLTIWALLVEDPWFQDCLRKQSRGAVAKFCGSLEWSDDIAQEAITRLGGLLRQDPSLGFNPEKGAYAGWMRLVLRTLCLKSLRQFREEREREVFGPEPATNASQSAHELAELFDEVQQLPRIERRIFLSYLQGKSIEQLAKEHQRSQRTVYRWLQSASIQLRERLAS